MGVQFIMGEHGLESPDFITTLVIRPAAGISGLFGIGYNIYLHLVVLINQQT